MRRILTTRWIKSANVLDLAAQLTRRRRVKARHVMAVLERPDGRSFAPLVAGLKDVPTSSVTRYLDKGERPPTELLARTRLADSDTARLLIRADATELLTLARNPHLGERQLDALCQEALAQGDDEVRAGLNAYLPGHPNLGPRAVEMLIEHSGGRVSMRFQWRPRSSDKGPSRWAEPITHCWARDGASYELGRLLDRDTLAPSEGMAPKFLEERFPEFFAGTCVRRGLDPEVAQALAQEWTGTSEDFYGACSELGPEVSSEAR
jgi:hypothetical protein